MPRERMDKQLRAAMVALEALKALPAVPHSIHYAALAGLGSKFLAIGTPSSLGLVGCGESAEAIDRCHELLFEALELRCCDATPIACNERVTRTSVEESLACDIVCLSTSDEFLTDWIADATHLNIVDNGPWSAGMHMLARDASITWAGQPRHALPKAHGSLADVIRGTVSGRMGEEITALLWTPETSLL